MSSALEGRERTLLVIVALVVFGVYALTAYPGITWWDSSEYSLAAVTLGVAHAPGSLLLTILGWLFTRVPIGLSQAHVLNLLAGALASFTAVLVLLVTYRMLMRTSTHGRSDQPAVGSLAATGAALGGLAFAFGETPWQYAIQFTPYILTAVITALLLWCLVRWWEDADTPNAWRWLLLLGLLFGLDFSVHRTNVLLLPALVPWILLRHPRTLITPRVWASGALGIMSGLLCQLLLIPIAAAHPPLNGGDPSTWSRFWDYVSLAQFGGSFLVQLYPRHAPLMSTQVMDFVRAFAANVCTLSGPLGVLGVLPAVFGAVGLVQLTRRDRRLGIAFGLLVVFQAVMTVLYFNIPANFFRTFSRHYLPVLVSWAVLSAYGLGDTLARLPLARRVGTWPRVALALLLLVPLAQLTRNWRPNEASQRHFTEDYARNALVGLPPDAVLFTVGDNDTFPLWYEQYAEGVRPDVRVVNLSLANASWYLDQIRRADPGFPLPSADDAQITRPWTDTTLMVPVSGTPADFGLPADAPLPDSIAVRATPTMAGKYVLLQDVVLLRILTGSRWRRPICFSTTAGEQGTKWLSPYRRLDGLFWRIVPRTDPPPNRHVLQANLFTRYSYRGYSAPNVMLDDMGRSMGLGYYRPWLALAREERAGGDAARCRQTREAMLRALPPSRLRPDDALRRDIDALC